MPKITYTPDDGSVHEWHFDANRLMSAEAEAIERHTGMTFVEFGQKLAMGSAIALHALVWVFLKRENPGVKFADVDFPMGAIQSAPDEDDRAEAGDEGPKDPEG